MQCLNLHGQTEMDREQFEQMTPEKLLDKITELNKRLFKMNQRSPMYNQMRALRSTGCIRRPNDGKVKHKTERDE